jgi:hypothetical protein
MDERQFTGGWATMADGSRVPLSAEDAQALGDAAVAADERDAADMPATKDALTTLCRAKERLRKLGWRDGTYCPKDGSQFAMVEYGSTGIFTGSFPGKWPYDFAQSMDGGTHPHGFLWKPLADLTEAEEAARMEAIASSAAYSERILQAFSAADEATP